LPRRVNRRRPSTPIKFIVPFAAGGLADVAARILAAPLSEKLGASIYIENRSGAGGNIGTGATARSDPDGHTFLATSGAFMLNPSLYEKVPYDPVADFDPIVEISNSPTVLTAIPALGVRSLSEPIALAKNDPNKLNFATPGVGTQGHLAGELLKLRAGIKMVAVNRSGAAPATQSLLAQSIRHRQSS
jgi:tripartite-type tricarboxylate transporter receptor subunit TctC